MVIIDSFVLSVCGIMSAVSLSHSSVSSGSCDNKWVSYNNKCYYSSTQMMNWHDAEKDCIRQRGHLLVVNDKKEMVNTELSRLK